MSYILDALRKADAQRARDPVRGIHAQPLRTSARADNRPGLKPGVIGACAAGIAALAWGGWYLYHQRGAAPVSQPPAVVAQAPAVRMPLPPPMAAPAPRMPAPVVGSAIQPPPPAPPVMPSIAAGPPQAGPLPGLDPRNTARPSLPGGVRPMPAGPGPLQGMPLPTAPGPAMAPPPATSALPPPQPSMETAQPVTGLPPDAPKLAISGGVYSANRAQRLLIVNGQVFNEGSEIGPGVVLEEIKAKTAVLRFRGSRFSVTY